MWVSARLIASEFFFFSLHIACTLVLRKAESRKLKLLSNLISVEEAKVKRQKLCSKSLKLETEILFSRSEAVSRKLKYKFFVSLYDVRSYTTSQLNFDYFSVTQQINLRPKNFKSLDIF